MTRIDEQQRRATVLQQLRYLLRFERSVEGNSDTSGGQGTLSAGSLGSGATQDVIGHRFFGSFTRQLNPLTSAGISVARSLSTR